MNKSQSKYFNTANKMNQAFLEILSKKDFEFITVKEICDLAKVNRSTFYLHYENMNDLLLECVENIHHQFYSYFKNTRDKLNVQEKNITQLNLISPDYLVPYLQFVKDNQKLFLTVISHGTIFNVEKTYQKMLLEIYNPNLDYFNYPENERQYILTFYLNGITAIVTQWIKNDCHTSIDEITQIIMKCVL